MGPQSTFYYKILKTTRVIYLYEVPGYFFDILLQHKKYIRFLGQNFNSTV